jgi:hypothetical protein
VGWRKKEGGAGQQSTQESTGQAFTGAEAWFYKGAIVCQLDKFVSFRKLEFSCILIFFVLAFFFIIIIIILFYFIAQNMTKTLELQHNA